MIDIFADEPENEQPKLYIADIVIEMIYPERKGSKHTRSHIVKLNKYPIVLLNGNLPTSNTEKSFFRQIHDQNVAMNNFDNTRFKIKSMDNVKFSSNLAYKFDFDKD